LRGRARQGAVCGTGTGRSDQRQQGPGPRSVPPWHDGDGFV